MAYCFGDSFDLYAAVADMPQGYWDGGVNPSNSSLVAGRFGGWAISMNASTGTSLNKSSGANDAVHHVVLAFRQSIAPSGSTLGAYVQFSDGATNQVCIVFRTDGAILLTSATPAGTVLDTYTGAFAIANQWYAFEFEVIVHPTAGRFRVRRNGNTSDDHDSGAVLNTRPGTNSYANKATLGAWSTIGGAHAIDDFLWRSDASSVAFVGDIRSYTRMPSSDQSVQFSRGQATMLQPLYTATTTATVANTVANFTPLVAGYDGTLGSVTVTMNSGYTGNMKCSLFSSVGGAPGTVLASATSITNPTTGSNTFTFASPPSVVKGTTYWLGFMSDTTSGSWGIVSGGTAGWKATTTYAAFPSASPAVTSNAQLGSSATITVGLNANLVSEAIQDGTATYVYDSTIGHADFYGLPALGVTPPTTIAVTTRGFIEKSDAGSRSGAVQLKSGATTVASPTTILSTSWSWLWRTDTTDPNTGAAWTAANVANVQIGPTVIS